MFETLYLLDTQNETTFFNCIVSNCKLCFSNNCLQCDDNYFLDFDNFCIEKIFKKQNCLNHNNFNFTCNECELDYLLVDINENKKICKHENDIIHNCLVYNENLGCVEYNRECNYIDHEECPICKFGFILVNEKCVDICSPEALNCTVCKNVCPIFLCMKIIHFCVDCDKQDFSKCIKCDDNFFLHNGICVRKEINENEEFRFCQKGCLKCFKGKCIKCENDYFFDKNLNLCVKNTSIVKYQFDQNICYNDLLCIENGKKYFQNCKKCRTDCECEIIYDNENDFTFLNCKNDKVILSSKELKKLNKNIYLNIKLDKS